MQEQNLSYLKKVVEGDRLHPVGPISFYDLRTPYVELARMELIRLGEWDGPVCYTNIDAALDWVRTRHDCAEFNIPALIRMLHEHRGTRLAEDYAQKIEDALIGFKYWLDEPGEVHACFFTENHQILYHSAEYLAGQLFPDAVFSNGETGAWHRAHATRCLRRWLGWRARFGFSEWVCDYYMEDILGMLGLACYAEEEDIRQNCRMLIDALVFDLAVNSFRGEVSGSHGRTYTQQLIDPQFQDTSPICRLLWGEGADTDANTPALLLACFDYRCPNAIQAAALDRRAVMINREHMSIEVEEAMEYGVDPQDPENIMLFWGIQAYSHRLTVDNSTRVFPYYNWMNNRVFAYREQYRLLDAAGVPAPSGTPDCTAMTAVDLYTYKTPDAMLSCAQDFRPGRRGYQQHPWSATLGGRCVVFTTNPGSTDYSARPNQLAGNLFLPRAAAHENVVFAVYRIQPDFVDFLYTHAYFPQQEFDEVSQRDGWVFGRKGDGYIALRSLNPARWEAPDPLLYQTVYGKAGAWEEKAAASKPFSLMAPGHANVWVCELGSRAQNGSFAAFTEAFCADALCGDTFDFTYKSPSQGEMRFGWTRGLTVRGAEIALHGYPRYDNPFCHAAFGARQLEICAGQARTALDYISPPTPLA